MTATTSDPPRSRRSLAALLALAAVGAGAASSSPAQSLLTFTTRGGQNTAYCGPPSSGPLVQHAFATLAPTHDSISVSDPGGTNYASSAATSQLDATPTLTGISLTAAGTATRGGGGGAYAVGDGRDNWDFTVSAPVHFTLSGALNAASTETSVPTLSFSLLASGPGAIVPDPGAPPLPYIAALSIPGSLALNASGTLMPGSYNVAVTGRAEGNSSPYTGSFRSSIALNLYGAAAVTARNAGTNPASYTCSLPILGQPWHANVDVSLTGHGFAVLYCSPSPAQLTLPGGQTLLLAAPLLQLSGALPGPQAAFTLNLPLNGALGGLVLPTQAVHFGVAPSFALSNALDLKFGS